MIGILGSGFGLYGYLPALIGGCHKDIILPERYRARFNERKELKQFSNKIEWAKDEVELLNYVSGVVLALSPIKQCEFIPKCLQLNNINFILLEKPLAYNPSISKNLLSDLFKSKKPFRLSFIFRYTPWGKKLLTDIGTLKNSGTIRISWKFTAHHFQNNLNNWKRFHSMGGGVICFYGIHLIALLSEMGYCNVLISQTFGETSDEIEKWVAIFDGINLPKCKIIIDTRSSSNEFNIKYLPEYGCEFDNTSFVSSHDPFSEIKKSYSNIEIDPRIELLINNYNSLQDNNQNDFNWYANTNLLWEKVERKNKFKLKKINV